MAEIMSYDEYVRSSRDKNLPYVVQIGQPPHVLTYVGVTHTQDAHHPQFAKIKALWQEFVASVDPANARALTEARVPSVTTSEEDGIRYGGESGLLSYLAYAAGITVNCPEPDLKTQFDALLQHYSADDILFYYTERVVAQYFRTDQKQTIEDYMAPYIARNQERLGPEAAHYSWDYLKTKMADYGMDSFDPSTAEQWLQLGNPTINGTQCNRVARASSIMRDKHVADTIIALYDQGKSIFATYGSTHVVMQEPYLRSHLEPSKGQK